MIFLLDDDSHGAHLRETNLQAFHPRLLNLLVDVLEVTLGPMDNLKSKWRKKKILGKGGLSTNRIEGVENVAMKVEKGIDKH